MHRPMRIAFPLTTTRPLSRFGVPAGFSGVEAPVGLGRRGCEGLVRMKLPNPISPGRIAPAERRAELCRLLAAGLLRLRARNLDNSVAETGSTLHSPPERSGHANPSPGRDA